MAFDELPKSYFVVSSMSQSNAVITLSYNRSFIERNPGTAKTRMKIVSKAKAQSIQKEGTSVLRGGKKYKRMLVTGADAPKYFEFKYEAYQHVLERARQEQDKGRTIEFDDSGSHQIYIMEMDVGALDEDRMKAQNDATLLRGERCFYVGLTEKEDPEVRYIEHRKPKGTSKSTDWGREYFLEPFEEAYRLDLLAQYTKDEGKATTQLIASEAHFRERDVAFWLRQQGHAAYFK